MNRSELDKQIAHMTGMMGTIAAYAGYLSEKPKLIKPKPIKPMPTWPVCSDTIIMTWKDYAICRP